jgi:hypothetical protein
VANASWQIVRGNAKEATHIFIEEVEDGKTKFNGGELLVTLIDKSHFVHDSISLSRRRSDRLWLIPGLVLGEGYGCIWLRDDPRDTLANPANREASDEQSTSHASFPSV